MAMTVHYLSFDRNNPLYNLYNNPKKQYNIFLDIGKNNKQMQYQYKVDLINSLTIRLQIMFIST